jgi:AraC-like DNA-binding protein
VTKLEQLSATSQYDEAAPVAGRVTTAHLDCVWTGRTGDDGGYTDRVLPDACIDVIWDGRRLFVAGPDTGPVLEPHARGGFFVGARFRPGHAPAFLGVPAAALLDQRVDVADLWGERPAARIRDDLEGAPTLEAAARRLELHLRAWAPQADERRAPHALRMAAEHDVAGVADALGLTERTLHRHCTHDFGYGAKTLHRVLRFRRFLDRAEMTGAPLARLAAVCGFADQAHLTALLASRGVRFVQDGG